MSTHFIRYPRTASPNQKPNSGFALIIALSLMSFVLVLLLTMTTLVKVEVANSTLTKQQLLARNNALLALKVALGNLQMAAGPDQRMTSKAAIRETTHPSKENYTAVWSSQATTGTVTSPLAWLVSGADEPGFSMTTASDANWLELVSARQNGNVEAVKAAPLSITDKNDNTNGKIAWWVGDEGVKATFNLVESAYLRDSEIDKNTRLGTSPRFGIEALPDFETLYNYEDDSFTASLRKTMNAQQGALLDSDLSNPLDDNFHDIGFNSLGLLTNTRDGGLKQDLTHYFEGQLGGPTGAIITGGTTALDRITWEQLNSFYNLGDELVGDTITARAQEQDQAGVYPLLTVLHLNFGFTMESNWNGVQPTAAIDRNYSVYAHMRPWFVLANPYNTTLEVSNYRIRFSQNTDANLIISYGTKGSPTDLISTKLNDILSNMIFIVPQVTLQPGEALYYSLEPSSNSSYGYTFTNDTSVPSSGNYASYTGFDTGTEQQFVFHADDDDGLTSIRMEPAQVITGNLIEDGNTSNPRIQPMFVSVDRWGASWLRTYTSNSPTLGVNEKILQDIGRFGFAGIASDNQYSTYHGYWEIGHLPANLKRYENFIPFKNDDGSDNAGLVPPANPLTSISLSFTYAMHNAINQGSELINSGQDGWATDYNIRAPRMSRYKEDQIHPTAYDFIERPNGFLWFTWMRAMDPSVALPHFQWAASNPKLGFTPAAAVTKAVLFDIPRLDAVTGQTAIASLGQLQHFNPSGWTETVFDNNAIDRDLDTLSYTPSYAIGNSYAAPQIQRESTTSNESGTTFSDISYLLNDALFDQYFFSSIPQTSGTLIEYDKLPNKRLLSTSQNTSDGTVRSSGTSAAENLFVDGVFNVNSTSVKAWYALLNSFRGFDFGDKTSGQGIFPRSLNQSPEFVEGDVDGATNDDAAWAGWRHIEDNASLLEDRTLYKLAEAIVEEVKARGPFVSMSDFVNRRLVANDDDEARLGLSGALQAALDRTLNQNFDEAYDVNPDLMASIGSWEGTSAATRLENEGVVDVEHLGSGPIRESDGSSLANSSSAASMPGWVLQADLLQALAPALSVRSDTFTIRCYGNALSILTGEVSAEAYLEAVVQRTQSYIDPSDAPETASAALSATNQLGGRKFSVVSIRFLDQSAL